MELFFFYWVGNARTAGTPVARGLGMPLVSVVMPAFNTASYIPRAITSALNQTMDDLEVLVVDDGSSDNTVAVVEGIIQRDARVRLLTQANGSAARARNRAMADAHGSFFALLDSDDEWLPGYLESQLSVLERGPDVAVVTANAWNRGGAFDGQTYWPRTSGSRRLTLLDLIEHEDAVCIMAVFRREVYAAIGGYDETFIRGSEDYDYWLRAAAAGFGFERQEQPLAFYQRREESLSAQHGDMLSGIVGALQNARSRSAADDPVRTAIDRQLRRFERDRLRLEAACALRGHDFETAAERFAALHDLARGARTALVAAWSRHAPTSLWLVDAMRRGVRRRNARTTAD